MDIDFSQQEGLDSSLLNPNFIGGGNRPIGRGRRVGFRTRVLPFYGYYNADGDIVMSASAPVSMVEQPAPAQPTVEYVQTETATTQVAPTETVSYQSAPIEPVYVQESAAPMPTETFTVAPVVDQNYVPSQVTQDAPQTVVDYAAPIVATWNPNALDSEGNPVGNQPPQTTTTTQTPPPTTTVPRQSAPTIPMGGGGGGVAPASTKTTTTTTTSPTGAVTKKTITEVKHGMSTGMKVGIAAVLLVGGYFAWKNKAKLGF